MNAINRKPPPNQTTKLAQQDTVLTPRFYTTEFDAMDRLNISPVRKDWDALMAEFRRDPNKGHFIRNGSFINDSLKDLGVGVDLAF